MSDINNIKFEPHLSLPKIQFGGNSDSNKKGGRGGFVILISKEFSGTGKITVDGGNGNPGGDAGTIRVDTLVNNFTGVYSAKGGKSSK